MQRKKSWLISVNRNITIKFNRVKISLQGSRFNKFILIEMFFIEHKIPFGLMGSFYNSSVIHDESRTKI